MAMTPWLAPAGGWGTTDPLFGGGTLGPSIEGLINSVMNPDLGLTPRGGSLQAMPTGHPTDILETDKCAALLSPLGRAPLVMHTVH